MESEGPFCKVRKKKSSIHCWHATTVEIGRSGRWLRKKPGEENTDQMVIFNKKREDSEWNRKGIRWWMIQKKKNGRKKRRNKSNFTALLFNDKVLHRYCRTGNFIMIDYDYYYSYSYNFYCNNNNLSLLFFAIYYIY